MKDKIKKVESMEFGTKGHKGAMPSHYAAESSGMKGSKIRPEKSKTSKPKSMVKKKITKK